MKDYVLGLYEKSMPNSYTIEQKLKAGKKAGFDFMELSIDESDQKLARLEWSKQQRRQIVNMMYDIGMPIKTMCLSGHRKYPFGSLDVQKQVKSLEIMKKAIELACDLGIRIIQIAGYDEYYNESNDQTKKQFLITLQKSVAYAAKYGVILGFETMETPFMNTVQKAMKYVKEIDSPYLKVYPDIGNITNASKLYHTDVFEDIKAGKGHIVAAHLKETLPGKYREVEFGTGHVDFGGCINVLKSLGVRVFVTEFWYNSSVDVDQYIKSAYNFITSKFDQI